MRGDKGMKKYKLINTNTNDILIPKPSIKTKPLSEINILNTSTITENIESNPVIIDTIIEDNNVTDTILTGKTVTYITDTISETTKINNIKNKYLKIYEDIDTLTDAKDKITNELNNIKINITSHNGTYDYQTKIRKFDNINKTYETKTNNRNDILKELPPHSSISSVTECLKHTISNETINGTKDTKLEVDDIITSLQNNSDITDINVNIDTIPDTTKDYIVDSTINFNTYKEVENLLKQSNSDITYTYKEIPYYKPVTISPKEVKTREEINTYINDIDNKYKIITKTINPVYIKKHIDESYDNIEDATKRKEELEHTYPNNIMVITKKHDITKDIVSTYILDEIFTDRYAAAKKIETIPDSETSVFSLNKLETITINNEKYSSEDDALSKVHSIKEEALKDTPVNYAITKKSNNYYLSCAYYAYKTYYQIEVHSTIQGYNYHVIGEIPEINTYRIEIDAQKLQNKYIVTRHELIKGYKYNYQINYQEKSYYKTYQVKSTRPLYQLFVKGQGSIKNTKVYNKTRTSEVPIYKIETRKQDNVLENNKTKILKHLN